MEGIKMSDADLRVALNEYGYPNTPITNTTRNILLKKVQFGHVKEKSKSEDECSSEGNKSKIRKINKRVPLTTHREQESTSRTFYKTTISEQVLKTVSPPSEISDDELRSALAQSGYKNMPITNSTRITLIKKMQTLVIHNEPQTSATECSDSESSVSDNEDNEDMESTNTVDVKSDPVDFETLNESSLYKLGVREEVSEMSSDCSDDYEMIDEYLTSDSESNYISDTDSDCTTTDYDYDYYN